MKRVLVTTLALYFFCVYALTTFAETLNEVKQKQNQVEQKMHNLEEQKKQTEELLKSAEKDKTKLLEAQKQADAQKEKLKNEQKKQENALRSIEDTLDEAEKDYEDSVKAFKARARSMYISSNKSYLDILLNSGNLVEFSSKLFVLNGIAKKDKEIIANLKTTKKDLDFKKELGKRDLATVQDRIQKTNQTLDKIASNQASIQDKILNINDKLKKIEQEEDALLEESRNLANKIKLFQNTSRKYIGGKMLWPTPSSYVVTSPYGVRFHPVLKYSRMHTGIDIGAYTGSSIVAVNDGIVRLSGWAGGYGNAVVIDHGGGISSLYGHCSILLVREGTAVKAGTTIAKVGSTGISTGPHLHFEVRENGEPVDPLNYLGK